MPSNQHWLAARWPFVRDNLPSPPATVLEIGCGPLGGFVPALVAAGYEAVGVDPEAPDAPGYHRSTFEQYESPGGLDAVVACTSLHHVGDLTEVLKRVESLLRDRGAFVVIEWAWERFDEATARWCFARLPPDDSDEEDGWLRRHRDSWLASGLTWDDHVQAWAKGEGLHTGGRIAGELQERFDPTELVTFGPFAFGDLPPGAEADERLAIERGEITATGIEFVGLRRSVAQ